MARKKVLDGEPRRQTINLGEKQFRYLLSKVERGNSISEYIRALIDKDMGGAENGKA